MRPRPFSRQQCRRNVRRAAQRSHHKSRETGKKRRPPSSAPAVVRSAGHVPIPPCPGSWPGLSAVSNPAHLRQAADTDTMQDPAAPVRTADDPSVSPIAADGHPGKLSPPKPSPFAAALPPEQADRRHKARQQPKEATITAPFTIRADSQPHFPACAEWTSASAVNRVILGCRGADIRVRRACRTRPVAPHGKADRGSRRRGERGAPSGTPRCCRNSRTSPACRLPAGCLETRGDPGQAEGYRPRNHPASQASAGGQAPGTSRRSPPVRSQSPRRSKVRLPGMSAPCHAVTLSDTGRHGERRHCRRSVLEWSLRSGMLAQRRSGLICAKPIPSQIRPSAMPNRRCAALFGRQLCPVSCRSDRGAARKAALQFLALTGTSRGAGGPTRCSRRDDADFVQWRQARG